MSAYSDPPLRVHFGAADHGNWRITEVRAIAGEGLAAAARLRITEGTEQPPPGALWTLTGATGHLQYTTRKEYDALRQRSAGLGRAEAECGCLIPIRKSPAWWSLAQDERRAIYEERSGHTRVGLEYLPQIARRLHHCRALGGPFDFLTWFEFAHGDAGLFRELLGRLRAAEEWTYVDREVEVWVRRDEGTV